MRDFKGVWVPKNLWLSTTIKPMEKFFLLEIDSLSRNGECYASNSHFAELFGVSPSWASEVISGLVNKGYLTSRQEREGKQVVRRYLKTTDLFGKLMGYSEKPENPIRNPEGGYSEKPEGNNTNKNNTNKNSKGRFTPPTFNEVVDWAKAKGREDQAKPFFDYYNDSDWYDAKGKKVKNWKGRFATWINRAYDKPKSLQPVYVPSGFGDE